MSLETPTVYMLCGLTGSGKTTAALELVSRGCERLSVDQVIFERFGRQDEDFSSSAYPVLHAQIIVELDERLAELLAQGRSVVLDYGTEFWTRESRDRYKQRIAAYGAAWELRYLKADRDLLMGRLRERNKRRDGDAFRVTEERLDAFIGQFEAPNGEGEIVRHQTDSSSSAGSVPAEKEGLG